MGLGCTHNNTGRNRARPEHLHDDIRSAELHVIRRSVHAGPGVYSNNSLMEKQTSLRAGSFPRQQEGWRISVDHFIWQHYLRLPDLDGIRQLRVPRRGWVRDWVRRRVLLERRRSRSHNLLCSQVHPRKTRTRPEIHLQQHPTRVNRTIHMAHPGRVTQGSRLLGTTKRVDAGKSSPIAQLLFDPQQPIVFSRAFAPTRCPRLYLSAVQRHCQICYRSIPGLS